MPRLSKIGAAALAAFGWTSGLSAVSASYLVVAGGGGGSNGGGGAGGYRTGTASLSLTDSYAVTVGAGGAGGNPNSTTNGVNGSSSVFTSITSAGGGGGGNGSSGGLGLAGGSGGGGGGWDPTSTGGAGNTPSTSPSQGNNGGTGANSGGAGGGGAGAVGSNGSTNTGGAGGAGTASSITGSSVTYAGGGGGRGFNTAGAGGSGGGGAGTTGSGTGSAGTANLGGGGGGSGATNAGGNGGSGVVIISYPAPQKFGGGIISTNGSTIIHTFQTSGTLSPLSSLSANYLVVAGGAGGGNSGSTNPAGGGGAGGLLTGSGAVIDTNSTYLVQVGAGGAGSNATNTAGTNGGNSYFSGYTVTAIGGGGGSSGSGAAVVGGSGGGGNFSSQTGAGVSLPGQGFAGGNAFNGADYAAGGGGGAGAVGANAASQVGGNGGIGVQTSISGTATYYAGGGGGGASSNSGNVAGTGGLGGGGNGGRGTTSSAVTGGTVNTGGGGGGGGYAFAQDGGSGGSGIVIVSYAGSTQLMAGGTVTISGGNVIHTFTSSGYLTPLTLVGNSLRFRSSASAWLNRTPATETNRKTFTLSYWVKRGELGVSDFHWEGGSPDGLTTRLYGRFNADSTVTIGNGSTFFLVTTQVFRDPAAWYHFVVAVDTTNATANNRIRLYVNGQEVTAFGTRNNPSQNADTGWDMAQPHSIGRSHIDNGNYFDGYITEFNAIDGQALTPNSFGTFNQFGVWQPIRYGGSYGTNGFYLPFTAGTSTFAGSFNGSNQWLSLAQNAAFNFGTGDFTIEACVYGNSWNSVNPIIALGDGAVGGGSPVYSGWAMRYDLTNGLGIYRFDGSETSLFSGATVPVNTWNHMAISRSSGTLRMFINGVQVYSAANTTTYSNVNSNTLKIGGNWVIGGGVVTWVNGFISNVRIVNNAGLYTSNFTPPTANLTAVSGTALLTLQNSSIVDNSTNAFSITNNNTVTTGQTYPFSAAKIFNDQGPAGNNWTPNNISGQFGSTLDYMTDVPTLTSTTAANYAVLNAVAAPTWAGTNFVNSNANLTCTYGYQTSPSTMAVTNSGQWYWEVTCVTNCGSGANNSRIGIVPFPYGTGTPGDMTSSYAYTATGQKGSGGTYASYGASYTDGDIIGVAFDSGAGTLTFYKNGVSQGTAYTGISGTYGAMNGSGSSSGTVSSINFGQRPFSYTPPTNYLALNTFNL
jgi:hypothetical protein